MVEHGHFFAESSQRSPVCPLGHGGALVVGIHHRLVAFPSPGVHSVVLKPKTIQHVRIHQPYRAH